MHGDPTELLVLRRMRGPVQDEPRERPLQGLHFDAVSRETHHHVNGRTLEDGELELRVLQRGQHPFNELLPWMGTMLKVGFSAALTPTLSPMSLTGPRIAAFVW